LFILHTTLDILYQGKKDKNAPSGEAAFKLYNVSLSAAPKSTVVSYFGYFAKIPRFQLILFRP